MKVLLIGATGNLGLRLVASLLTHNHSVVAYVRSSTKLESLLPESVFRQITVVQGNATDAAAIKRAILDAGCDAVVNTAGVAAVAPWAKTDLPVIFRAVVDGVREAGEERKRPLRVWFLAGLGVLHYPGSEVMLSSYMPIFLAHRTNHALLASLPPNTLNWSMLCPSTMTPEAADMTVPTPPSKSGKLIASATTPPAWQDSGMNAGRYDTTLEQNAEFIAGDLAGGEASQWSGKAVGVISEGK
ncbi:hypothetical protein BDV95DRAFT_40941 [Massariosphaeria phaeospora]|uniref:NAD(P)-binding domain-containing protein n=1 Tax=Massariosphaeria phaeospora TaxID=100035 RepID=A0A7C8I5P0_9PLEO|nr:hypothetical protein BDV95DRAFT_40941 [Massariosphaeria phaeospora]